MASVFIGLATYNSEKFIGETIESLQKQTYTDWKLFISDDESTDGTRKICEKYTESDKRIIYFEQPKNIGQFENFKYVLEKSDGDYFMWAGHDDLWDKNYLKVCVENFGRYPDRGVSFTGHKLINTNGSTAIEYTTFPKLSGPKNLLTVARFVMEPEVLGKPNIIYALYRTECAKKAFEYFPHQPTWGSDIIFGLAAISHYGIIIDKQTLFSKRLGGYSDSRKGERGPDEKIVIDNPKNHIFPIGGGRFYWYLKGHMQALKDTYYQIPVFLILVIRSVRALVIFLRPRIAKKLKTISLFEDY